MKKRTPLFRIDRLLIAALALLAAPLAQAQVTTNVFFFDNFDEPNSTSLGSATNTNNATSYPWLEGGSGGTNNTRIAIVSSNLVISNTTPAGRDWAYVALTNTSGFNTTYSSSTATSLEWYVNMRQSRTDPSGFGGSAYGAAFIIGASSTNFIGSGVTGYALLYGQGGSTDPLRFVYFTNGLAADSSIVNVITATNTGADIGNQFLSLRLNYNVASNSWSLFGTTNASFVDPWTNSSLASYGTASNSTYTGTSLSFMGAFYNYATAAGETASFDNIRVASIIEAIISALNWIGGSGNWSDGFGGTVTNGSALSFSGAGGIATNNLVAPLITSMTFSNSAGSYTVAGDAFTISNGIVNNSANAQTFSNAITLGAAQTFSAASGGMTFAGNITNGGFRLTVDGASNTVVSGAISGSGGLTKSGAGTLTVSGSSTYSGATLIAAGGLTVGASNSLPTGTAVTVGTSGATANGGRFNIGDGLSQTVGSLTLLGGNTSDVNSGQVLIGVGSTLVLNGNITYETGGNNRFRSYISGGTLDLGGATRTVTVNDNNNTADLEIDSVIANGSLTKAGTGILQLDAANTLGGTVLISAGELALYNTNALQNATLDVGTSGAQLVSFNTNGALTYNIGALAGADALAISNNTLSIGGNNANSSMTGAISGTGGSITKVGLGTLTLQSTTSSYSGTTRVSAGTLRVQTSANSLGTSAVDMAGGNLELAANTGQTFGRNTTVASNSTITIDRTTAGAGVNHTMGTLSIGAQTLNVAKGSLINAGSTGGLIFGATTLTASGATFNTASETALTLASVGGSGFSFTATGSGNTTVSGAITTGAGSVTKSGLGTLTLSGANTYNGGTLVSAGALSGSTTSLRGAITNNGTVIFSQSTNGTYDGVLSGAGGALTKSGTGTVTMTAANTFSGPTTITAGRLLVNGTNANSAVTINTNASLGGSGQVGDLTVSGLLAPGNSVGSLSAGSTIFNTNGAFELEIFDFTGSAGTGWDLLTVNGDLTLSNTSVSPFTINLVSMSATNTTGSAINFNADQSFTNTFLTYSGGLLGNPFATNLFTINTNSFANALNGAFSIANVGQSLALVYTTSYVPPSSFTWSAGSGLWSDTNNWSEASSPTAGAGIVFAGAAGGNSTNDQVNSVSGLNFSNTAGSFTVSGNAMTNGADGIVNNSANAQTINNDLALGAVQTFNAASGDLTFGGAITNNGNLLTVDGVANTALNGAVSGNGGLNKSGAGSLTLGGNSSFTGTLAATEGTIIVNGTQAATSINVAGGTVLLGDANRLADGATITLSSGALNLNGNDSVGAVTLTGGTIGGSGILSGASYAVQAGTISAGVGGSGAMTKTGAGTTTLSASNSGYSGAVAVNSGALLATTSGALGTGAVTMTNGSTLAGNGVSLANNFTIGTAAGAGSTAALQSWDFTGLSSPATAASTFTNASLATGVSLNLLTRGAGAAASSAANSFRTTGFQNNGISTNNTDYFEWKIASTVDGLSLRTLDARFNGTSSYFASPGATNQFAWSTNGSDFNLISSPFVMTAATSMPQIDLSGVTGLQNLGTNTTVTFRFYATGQTPTGGWGFNSPGAGTNGLSLAGAFQTAPTGSGALGINEAGTATFSGNIVNNNAATFTAASGGTATFSGAISGAGSLTKTGVGTVTLSGASANTFAGAITVSAGTLQLNKSTDVAAIAGNITVNSGAVLLLSSSGNIANSSAVTLSGGTITRGAGVNEAFSSLNLTTGSFLDFGTGATGTMTFGTYEENTTPSALLTVNNFLPGNSFTFSNAQFAANGSNIGAYFTFGTGFQGQSISNLGGGSFTITAIPEPSTYLAAAGLLSLMLWPSRKRLLKDAKKILGLRAPMRDRLAAQRQKA